jgi:hypothetical protein
MTKKICFAGAYGIRFFRAAHSNELDKTVGDPVDVLVNGRIFARGEVVTVSESFGVRITELLNSSGEATG